MHLNQGLFRLNGGCGYILKPAVMRNKEAMEAGDSAPFLPDMTEPIPGVPPVELEIEVCGSHLVSLSLSLTWVYPFPSLLSPPLLPSLTISFSLKLVSGQRLCPWAKKATSVSVEIHTYGINHDCDRMPPASVRHRRRSGQCISLYNVSSSFHPPLALSLPPSPPPSFL